MRPLPALATTLLLRLGPGDESFAGDLAEEYAAGRSRAWYWRQVLALGVIVGAVVMEEVQYPSERVAGTGVRCSGRSC